MRIPTKKMWARIGAAGIIAAAFASAAIAAETTGTPDTAVTALTAGVSNAVSKVSLPTAAGQVATAVLDAIAGDTSPSITQRSDDGTRGQGKSEGTSEGKSGGEAPGLISAAQQIVGAGTVGVRPGWGCGDLNHTHTGPPGRPPDAKSPCAK